MIYLDNNATTQISKEVKEAMWQCLDFPLNPSSIHQYGQKAKQLLITAKQSFASKLLVHPQEIVFTSGGTESMNMLIKGLYKGHGKILTSDLEHPCVYETLKSMQLPQENLIFLQPHLYGAPQVQEVENYLKEDISLMVFSAVYSETGVKLDLTGIAQLAQKYQIPIAIDGVALLGKEDFSIPQGITGMGFSAHKIHGPMGVGCIYLSRKACFTPLFYGGFQQQGKRSGTENMPSIIGFQKAFEQAYDSYPNSINHMKHLQKVFINSLQQGGLKFYINGEGPKICNTINLFFEDVTGETLLIALDRSNVLASLGSACSSGSLEPSKVLMNMGYNPIRAQNSLRFSWSRYTTLEEIKKATDIIIQTIKALKN